MLLILQVKYGGKMVTELTSEIVKDYGINIEK